MDKQRLAPLRVLVAEDDEQLRYFLELKFTLDGFETCCVSDGIEALGAEEEFHPDILVCDIMMPRLSGISVCKELRSHPATKILPIVLLTSKSFDEDIEQLLHLGKITYLPKPFDATTLTKTVLEMAGRDVDEVSLSGLPAMRQHPGSWLYALGRRPVNLD